MCLQIKNSVFHLSAGAVHKDIVLQPGASLLQLTYADYGHFWQKYFLI
jgi:hypothetical protein